jgi:succinyl-CoA synthetase alpha subunit
VAKSQIETEEEQIMDLDFLKTRHHLLWFSLKKTTALIFAKASPTKTTLARSCNFNTMAKAKANAFAIYVPPPYAAFVFLEAMESLSMIW